MHLLITLVVALLLGFTYRNIDNGIPGSQNRFGFLFFIVMYFTLVSMSSIGSFVKELDLFNRERARGYYSTWPYFLSKLLTDFIPFRMLPPMLFAAICYPMIGLQMDAYRIRFMSFVLVLILTNLAATSVCFAYAALYGNVGQANLAAVLTFVFSMLFGGLFLNNSTVSSSTSDGDQTTSAVGLSNLRYASFMFYAYSSLMSNEFSGLVLEWKAQGKPSI